MKCFNTVLLALGLAFVVYLVERTGWKQLWQQLRILGWGITLIVVAEGLANVAHTVGWRHCIPGSRTQLSLWQLFRMNMAGWAINYLTPTASVGGEVSRASLLAAKRNGTDAAGSVLLDKLMTAVAHLVLVVFGALFLFWRVKLPIQLWIAMVMTTAFLTVGIAGFLVMQIRGTAGIVCRWLVKHKLGGRFMAGVAKNLWRVDALVKQFYRQRSHDLVLSVFWHALGHSVAIVHVWLFLTLLGQPASLVAVAAAACLALWFDLLTFAVPINLGTLEASRIVVLKVLGCQALLGMAFGVAIRAVQVFWACFGLVSYAFTTLRRKEAAQRRCDCPKNESALNIYMEETT